MEIKEIMKFAEESQEKISKYYSKSKEELIPYHALKIGEELGELLEQVLAHQNIQRKDKAIDKKQIGEEVADVLLATLILAKSLNLDVESEIKRKIEKNKGRLN